MRTQINYEERSGWSWWVHLLIMTTFFAAVFPLIEMGKGNVGGGADSMPVWAAALCLLLGFGIPFFLYLLMGQLRTRVTTLGLDIRWGYSEIIKKRIPFEEIQEAEAVTYSPMGEFGGWGIRVGRNKKRAWNIRGNRAVLLHLRDGTRFYLGSDRPERILQWITSAKRRTEE